MHDTGTIDPKTFRKSSMQILSNAKWINEINKEKWIDEINKEKYFWKGELLHVSTVAVFLKSNKCKY